MGVGPISMVYLPEIAHGISPHNDAQREAATLLHLPAVFFFLLKSKTCKGHQVSAGIQGMLFIAQASRQISLSTHQEIRC